MGIKARSKERRKRIVANRAANFEAAENGILISGKNKLPSNACPP